LSRSGFLLDMVYAPDSSSEGTAESPKLPLHALRVLFVRSNGTFTGSYASGVSMSRLIGWVRCRKRHVYVLSVAMHSQFGWVGRDFRCLNGLQKQLAARSVRHVNGWCRPW
jgi:hypothetical protein